MKRISIGLLLVSLVCGASPGWCRDPDEGWKTIGIMAGVNASRRTEYFHAYEATISYGLPLSVRTESGWGPAMQVNCTTGVLHAADVTGVIGSLGLGVVVDKRGKGIAFSLGGDVNVLSKHKFGSVDLNGDSLFDGHVGVAYRFESGPGVFYRFLHMSNGGMGLRGNGNTGLDLHMFGVSWNF